MESAIIYLLFALTSAVAIGFSILKLGLKVSTLVRVLGELSECVGACVVFFAVNVTIGIVAVLLVRGTLGFVSLYPLTSVMLVLLSAIQGFVFQLWWRRS